MHNNCWCPDSGLGNFDDFKDDSDYYDYNYDDNHAFHFELSCLHQKKE